MKHATVSFLALLGSMGTLFCCVLPAVFVALGAGAVLAGIITAVPQITWISEHKIALFIFAGVMLTLSGIMRYTTRNALCPSDPGMAKACTRMRRVGGVVFYTSLTMYAIGFFFAFIIRYLV